MTYPEYQLQSVNTSLKVCCIAPAVVKTCLGSLSNCYCNWNIVMSHVPKYCSMTEPHCIMQWIWLVRYTAHQTLPFCCRSAWFWLTRLQWNLSNTHTLKAALLVLISEVSLFQGENKCKVGTQANCPDIPSILVSGRSFKRGSMHCMHVQTQRPQHLQETSCLVLGTGHC